jgi:hypothetical protein
MRKFSRLLGMDGEHAVYLDLKSPLSEFPGIYLMMSVDPDGHIYPKGSWVLEYFNECLIRESRGKD